MLQGLQKRTWNMELLLIEIPRSVWMWCLSVPFHYRRLFQSEMTNFSLATIFLTIGWCYACGRPAHISAPVQRPCQPSDAWSTPLAERCIEDSIQTVRLCVLAFQCRNGATPSYLASCCIPVASVIGRSCLRSAASGDFLVPACFTRTLGPRAFAVSCPASWNSLPPDIRAPGISLVTFKKKLKTFLFSHML